jgi:hypothetical protein
MKTGLTFLTVLLFVFADTNGQTIPNSGFENWTLIAEQFMNPDDWETNAGDFSINVVPESPGYAGNYALKLNTTGYARSKFSFSEHPSNIKVYVKCTFSTVDTVKIKAFVYSGNNIVDYGDWINTSSIPNWTLITFPVSVSFSSVDSLEILITCGNQTGTSISVDELSYSPITSINESNQYNKCNIFPNPFSTQTIFQTAKPFYNATLTIDNVFGQTVKKINNISGQTVTLFRDNLQNGFYFVRLTEGNRVITTNKVVITE